MIQQNEQATIIHAAFDQTGVKFHNRAAALADFKADGREITFDDNSQPSTHYDGQMLPLAEALLRYAYDRRDLIDSRGLPRQGVSATRPGLASKADYKTRAEKIAYIEAHGDAAWAALSLTSSSPDGEITTREEFDALPRAEKVARINADEFCRAKLPSAPKPHPFEKALTQTQSSHNTSGFTRLLRVSQSPQCCKLKT